MPVRRSYRSIGAPVAHGTVLLRHCLLAAALEVVQDDQQLITVGVGVPGMCQSDTPLTLWVLHVWQFTHHGCIARHYCLLCVSVHSSARISTFKAL